MGEPLFLIQLESGESMLVNESQVVTVRKAKNGNALITLSNGEELIVVIPNYDDWEDDFHVRKF